MPSRVRRKRPNEPATEERQAPNLSGIGQPPPEGLVPIGESGFYITPDEPADPRDCDRYPDSPWCGGQPFTRLPVELGIEYTLNEEGFSLSVLPAFAFIKLPPFSIAYRFPEYRDLIEEPSYTPDPINFVPPPPVDWSKVPESGYGYVVLSKESHAFGSFPEGFKNRSETYSLVSVVFPGQKLDVRPTGTKKTFVDVTYIRNYQEKDSTLNPPTNINISQTIQASLSEHDTDRFATAFSIPNVASDGQLTPEFIIVAGTFQAIRARYINPPSAFSSDADGSSYQYARYTVLWCDQLKWNNAPALPLTPKCDCMTCCSDIAALMELVKKLVRTMGCDEFPASMPKNLTTEAGQQEEIPNMAKLLRKQTFYMDEIIGEAQVKITIEDVDPTKEGNQSETMEFGNISELMAENFGVAMNTSIDASMLIQICSKALMEAGISRKQITTLESKVDALIAHQGFSYEEKLQELPFTFNVPNTTKLNEFTLEQFIKESVQKVPIFKFTGKETYAEDSSILRSLNGMIRGMFFRKVATGAVSVAEEIKKLLKKQDDTINKISKENESLDDLDVWIDEFEVGFTQGGYSGTQLDTSKPFGIDYDKRPRVRRMTKPTTNNPGTGQG